MAIIHIYVARTIYLLFCDNQDTESESLEINIGVSEQLLTQKKWWSLWENDIYTTQDVINMLWDFFHIYGDRTNLLLYCDH